MDPRARTLVRWSHILGWGGLGVVILLAPVVGVATESATAGFVAAGLGGASTLTGAILGQIGRAMQGRVI